MKEAIYAASLDPITKGHKNLVERALKVFDRIVVAIGVNEAKKPLFSLKERESMAKKDLAEFGNHVQVRSFEGMLSDFAFENNISTIIRGARSTPDFDYEKLLGDINRYSGVDTIIYTSTPELSHVSSSAAKAIVLNAGKNILDYVSIDVKRRMEEELLYQFRIGITGMIGSGKSFIAKEFIEYLHKENVDIHTIDMDQIGHFILESKTVPAYIKVQNELGNIFNITKRNGSIDIKKLGKIIFNNMMDKNTFDNEMLAPMMHELRKRLLEMKGTKNKKSIVLVQGALLCEANGLSEINNNIILVKCSRDIITKRLQETRGYSSEEIKKRISSQWSFENKRGAIKTLININGCGHLWIVDNDKHRNQLERGATYKPILNDLNKDATCV